MADQYQINKDIRNQWMITLIEFKEIKANPGQPLTKNQHITNTEYNATPDIEELKSKCNEKATLLRVLDKTLKQLEGCHSSTTIEKYVRQLIIQCKEFKERIYSESAMKLQPPIYKLFTTNSIDLIPVNQSLKYDIEVVNSKCKILQNGIENRKKEIKNLWVMVLEINDKIWQLERHRKIEDRKNKIKLLISITRNVKTTSLFDYSDSNDIKIRTSTPK